MHHSRALLGGVAAYRQTVVSSSSRPATSKNRVTYSIIVGIDEDVELIAAFLLVVGSLPFVLAWLERSLDTPPTARSHWWQRHVGRSRTVASDELPDLSRRVDPPPAHDDRPSRDDQ